MAHRTLRRLVPLAAAASVAALALTACSGSAAARPAADAQLVKGGTIVYAHQQEPSCIFGGWIEQAYISYQVLDSLFSLDADGNAVPWLGESWEVSDDGLTYTIALKKGVSFTDGTPVNAEAVAYNFDYWVGGGNSTARVWLGGYYESAEAVDDTTVAIHLSRPYTNFIQNLTQGYFGIQSQHALETRTDEENCAAPIGSGAFTVEEWNRGQNVILARNDDYTSWPANAEHTGPAYVDTVDWRFVADPTTRVAALQSGQANLIYDVPATSWETLDTAGYTLEKYVTAGRPQQISFNTAEGPFVDENVRKAFVYALDRKQIVDTIGQGVIPYEGNGAVSQTTPAYSQEAADLYTYDPEKADELLDAAGWSETNADGYRVKDGEVLDVLLPYGAGSIINTDGASILQAVQEQAKAVGFKVELRPLSQADLWGGDYSTPDSYDLSVGYWTAINAGILYINWRPSTDDDPNYSNSAFYSDPELERLILAANSEADPATQDDLYAQAQNYIADHATSVGLYDRLSTLAVSPDLQGVWQEHAQGGPTFYDAHFVE
ncbi:ABC transporter substrate-binding protein [Microbacterium sp. cx-59]|uniref:ABC transporter substrate-binding protein n=1 Tax=Microbacterium sp. cx-59 TaxID=2891207 RepID=UPI001E471BB2|nr:ABC transporter substrate-binding protein [Microbacterium sp. cx-59]MCC4908136.1 ABC transporter substrate-binding protein [Microbacterium sp. cx-59]